MVVLLHWLIESKMLLIGSWPWNCGPVWDVEAFVLSCWVATATAAEGHQGILGEGGLADGALLRGCGLSLQPLENARPTVEVAAEGDHRIGCKVQTNAAVKACGGWGVRVGCSSTSIRAVGFWWFSTRKGFVHRFIDSFCLHLFVDLVCLYMETGRSTLLNKNTNEFQMKNNEIV